MNHCRFRHTRTLLKDTPTHSPKPVTFLQFTHWNATVLPASSRSGSPPDRTSWQKENLTCHLRYSASRYLILPPSLEDMQSQFQVKRDVGVITGVKGSCGTSQLTNRCVVIQIQRNIWELVQVEPLLLHLCLSYDIGAGYLQCGTVVIRQIMVILCCWTWGQLKLKKKKWKCA